MKFDNSSLIIPIQYTQLVVIVLLGGVKNSRKATTCSLIYLWDSRASNFMIKRKHVKPYKAKLRSNKTENNTDSSTYWTKHAVKVPFFIVVFLSRKIKWCSWFRVLKPNNSIKYLNSPTRFSYHIGRTTF